MIAPDELERYFQHRTEQDAFSGVVLITQSSTQLFAGTYGYASRSWKVPNTLTMRFDTASVTKLFTAVATLLLNGSTNYQVLGSSRFPISIDALDP